MMGKMIYLASYIAILCVYTSGSLDYCKHACSLYYFDSDQILLLPSPKIIQRNWMINFYFDSKLPQEHLDQCCLLMDKAVLSYTLRQLL